MDYCRRMIMQDGKKVKDNPNIEEVNDEVVSVESNEETSNETNESQEKKPKRLKYILSILFLVALIVATVIILFTKYDIRDIFNTLAELDIKYIIIGILLMFVYILFEGIRLTATAPANPNAMHFVHKFFFIENKYSLNVTILLNFDVNINTLISLCQRIGIDFSATFKFLTISQALHNYQNHAPASFITCPVR